MIELCISLVSHRDRHLAATVMSNPDLPAELVEKIVDLLRDDADTLKRCCLVSKSWIPLTRKHLFANIEFRSPEMLQAWKDTFPDPSTSPACYTKSLRVPVYSDDITLADAEEGGWIPTFSQVERFVMVIEEEQEISLVPFHGFSPILKSLDIHQVYSLSSYISGLIYSFPLLEDLSVAACCGFECDDDFNQQLAGTWPSNLPPFTGCLGLYVGSGMGIIASGLQSLPSGLHFRELKLKLGNEADISFATSLVEECSSTLRSLQIDYDDCMSVPRCIYADGLPLFADESSCFVDLSKATGLRSVVFLRSSDPQWIATTLRTITCNHRNFQQLSIHAQRTLDSEDLVAIKDDIGEDGYIGWLELDHFLAQLHELHSTRLKLLFRGDEQRARSCAELLLPEVMAGGIVDLENSHAVKEA